MSKKSNDDNQQGNLDLVFPASLVAAALRSGPYRNSASAIAEIVDNSYDAEAKEIHIALIYSGAPESRRMPHTIAVLDNGKGMDEDVLRSSIQHGRHQKNQKASQNRIGKFGVGLLSASFNQCKDLEIYSWNNGLRDSVNSTGIRVDKCPQVLPDVVSKPLPDFFEQAFSFLDKDASNLVTHGTLVVWRELDRLTWKRVATLSDKLQQEIGRIYRNFLTKPTLKITITTVEQSEAAFKIEKQIIVQPVDPLFINYWDCPELKRYTEDLQVIESDPEKYGVTKEQVEAAKTHKTIFIPFDFDNEDDNAYDEDGEIKVASYSVQEQGKIVGKYRIIASYRRPQIVRAAAWAKHRRARRLAKSW